MQPGNHIRQSDVDESGCGKGQDRTNERLQTPERHIGKDRAGNGCRTGEQVPAQGPRVPAIPAQPCTSPLGPEICLKTVPPAPAFREASLDKSRRGKICLIPSYRVTRHKSSVTPASELRSGPRRAHPAVYSPVSSCEDRRCDNSRRQPKPLDPHTEPGSIARLPPQPLP